MNKVTVWFCVLLGCSTVAAQQELQIEVATAEPDVVVSGADGSDFQVFQFSTVSEAPLPAMDVPVTGEFLRAASFASPFMPQDALGIASSPQFIDELGIVDDQRERLVNLNRTISKARNEMVQSIHVKRQEHIKQNGGKPGSFNPGEYFRENEKKFREQIKEGVNDILLPHQVKRLEQLEVQMKIRSGGARAVAGDFLANTLDLTDEQRKELREKEREAQRELNEKIAKLREEARERVLEEVLTTAQQEKLAELKGDKFEVKRPERGNRVREQARQIERERASRKRDAESRRRRNGR